MRSPQYGSQSTPFTHATHVSAISHVPDTSRDSHELINRRIGINANRNNGDRLMTIKADPVGGKDMQRKSGRPRVVYACVRSLHHIIPSTFFYLALRPLRVSEYNFIQMLSASYHYRASCV